MSDLEQRLADLDERGLRRRMRVVSGPQGSRVVLDGKPVLVLCSNNYLGLAEHQQVREAAAEAALRYGAGAGASRLVSGTMSIHRRLETSLAAFKGTESAVLFGSGYLANLGVVSALAGLGGRDTVVYSDALNHASIIDGCRLAQAQTVVYDHCDVEHLAFLMEQHKGRPGLIVTDSVFSMDGDIAPLAELAELKARHGARLIVDEAHGTGCCGPGGRGAVAEAGLEDGAVDVIVGTLGKALGSYGAFAACSATMADFLTNTSRPLIFSTAPAPSSVAAALAALELVTTDGSHTAQLQANARTLRDALAREGFEIAGSSTQIIPLIVGDAALAMRICELAIEGGVFAQAIRPPTVPEGTSRLRLAVMASHSKAELREAATVLGKAALRAGFRPASGLPVAATQGAPSPRAVRAVHAA